MDLRVIKKELRAQGFICYRNVYMRVKNDVLQSVCVRLRPFCKTYCVHFDVNPLCRGIWKRHLGLDCIFDFEKYYFDIRPWYMQKWSYARMEDPSKEECLESIYQSVFNDLLPLLSEMDSCLHGFDVLLKYLRRCEDNRLASLKADGDTDGAIHSFDERILFEGRLLYMALKNDNYEFSEKSVTALLKNSEQGYRRAMQMPEDYTQEWRDSCLENIERRKELLANIQNRDSEAIHSMLARNEALSLEELKGIGEWK